MSADAEAVAVRYGRTIFDLRGDGDGPRIQPNGFRGAKGSVGGKELLPEVVDLMMASVIGGSASRVSLTFAQKNAKTQA